jgi:outer membrane protein OmpU
MMAAAAVAGTASAQTAAKKPNEKITLQLGGYYHASYIIGDESRGQRACPIATGCADLSGGLAAGIGAGSGINPTFGFPVAVPFGGNVNEPGRGRRFQRLQHEAEVYFRGQTTLDNGLTIGAFIQLEAATQNDIIDETYIYFSGSFGRVEYGSMDSVGEQMYYGAPSAIEQQSTIVRNTGMPTFATGSNAVAYPATGPSITGYSDNDKVNYYTPRIAGFQFGITYQPEVCEDFGTDVIGGVGSGGGVGGGTVTPGAAGAVGSGGCPTGFSPSANPGQQGDLAAISVNYVNKFGPVDVGTAFWFQKANLEGTTGFGSQNGIFATDQKAMGFGVNVSAYGFTLGGGWSKNNVGVRSNNTDRTDWNIGARYRTGPWQLGLEYGYGERGAGLNPAGAAGAALPGGALGRAGEDSAEVFMAAVDYTMGPGIRFYGGIQYFNLDDNFGNPAAENDGVLFILGTRLDF